MRRRDLLHASIGATLLRANSSAAPASQSTTPPARRPGRNTPECLATYTPRDHRRRLENVALCERGIRNCMRKHLVTSYLPGQCVYNLGEYPCRKPWDPDQWDEGELDRLRHHGIRLIQVHEEWNDVLRLFGQSKYTPLNPAGFRRFVDMVHARGMKLIVYVSTGFFDFRDPDFRDHWARQPSLVQFYWRYARCSPASPGWRAYLLPRLVRLMDDYGVDGLYNDLGYLPLAGNASPPTKDEVLAFEERPEHDAALEDLLTLIYAEVKRRRGIVKVHVSDTQCPHTRLKVYDYLWVGESINNVDHLRQAVKNHPPYVVPCLDMSRAGIENEDELYLNAIPYMQFPLLLAGRPFTGERAVIPGVEYKDQKECFWTRHLRAIWKHHQDHPDGPHSYGWWDSVPGRPQARPTHARWLKRYLPLIEEGTRAYLEIADTDLLAQPLPANLVASAFANRNLHLVLANYNNAPAHVTTRYPYTATANTPAHPKTTWTLAPRSLLILRR